MDELEILKRQVDALEKLLQIKDAIIQEQEKKISKLEMETIIGRPIQFPQMPPAPPMYPSNIPSVWTNDTCNDGGFHDYPNPWLGTIPPPCNKCGKVSNSGFTVTSSSSALVDEERALGTISDIEYKKGV